MIYNQTSIEGLFTIDLDKREDERGFFARFFCADEFKKHGLDPKIVQINNSFSKFKGTLRGIHYQTFPKSETKIVRCLKGSIYDVVVDLRSDSPSFCKWYAEKLTADNRRMMYVPKGFGHAFLTLEDNTEVIYLVTEFYSPEYEKGIRWNDPKIGINWPFDPIVISDKDKSYSDYNSRSI